MLYFYIALKTKKFKERIKLAISSCTVENLFEKRSESQFVDNMSTVTRILGCNLSQPLMHSKFSRPNHPRSTTITCLRNNDSSPPLDIVIDSLLLPRLAGAAAAAVLLLFSSPVDIASAATTRLTQDELSTIKLFKKSTSGVVYITNIGLRRDGITFNELEVPQGAGSGFVWDKEGHIVTNFHVIKGATELSVTLTGGNDYKAKVIGTDEDKDVAVLLIDTNGKDMLKPLERGTSTGLEVGQRVYAVGNPFGLDHSLTTGVVSGTGREINSGNTGRPIQDVIQTDAAINPGNSGGPLLDSSGAVIGINTAIFSPSGANAGVGFALPIDVVQSSVQQILEFGRVIRPILGISFAPDRSVEQLGVSGVLVLDVKVDSPAQKAGLKGTERDSYGRLVLGDVINTIDSNPVKTGSDLYKALDKKRVGDRIVIGVKRGDAMVDVDVTLEASS